MFLYNLNDHSDAWSDIAYRLLVLCYGIYRAKTENRGFIVDWSLDYLYHTESNLNLFNTLFQLKNIPEYENKIQDCERIGLAKTLKYISEYELDVRGIIEEHISINRSCKLKAQKFLKIHSPNNLIGGCLRLSSLKSIIDNSGFGSSLVFLANKMKEKRVFLISDMPINLGKETIRYIDSSKRDSIWLAHKHLTEYMILSQCKERYFYRSEYIKPIILAFEQLI